ncbi:MAG: hypothetical protein RR945_00015 [Erysipelotrichaceae bacterium]
MKVTYLDYHLIHYQPKEYDLQLYESVQRIGCSFPIHVEILDQQYYCLDGHKRLSILHDLNDPNKTQVMILIKNNGNNRSDGGWSLRNHH